MMVTDDSVLRIASMHAQAIGNAGQDLRRFEGQVQRAGWSWGVQLRWIRSFAGYWVVIYFATQKYKLQV